ncbi:MAG: response regulator [Myxococcales bacterium]|nr:response regulator [Myxococcales bacterium]
MPRRVLIAEDEALIALELERRLTSMGFAVTDVVATGEAALERALKGQPELLLFDIRLAGPLDGVEAARRIQAERRTPVVFLSAFDDDETLERVRRVPHSHYLLKPFDPRLLQITLDAVLFKFEAEQAQEREERRRRALEHRLAVMLDQSRDAIVSLDDDLRVVVFNRGASEVFGWPAHQALGLSFEALLPVDERVARRALLERVLHGEAADGEASTKMRCLRRTGAVFSAEVSVARVEVDADTILTMILRDVTEREQLQQRFVDAQKLEAVGRFAAGVAHDFQTLLSTIHAHVFIASRELEGPPRASLDAIAETVERGAALARSLLAVARQDRVSDAQPLDVSLELHAMTPLLRAVAHGSIELELSLQAGAGVAELGEAELEQVMLNLVANARDAMPDGGPLRVSTREIHLEHASVLSTGTLPPGRYVEVKVEDSGTGLDATTLARAFDPFFTTKPVGQGTGLGLTTVRAIVHARGGAFDLRSTTRGAIARVLFPAVDADARAPISHAAAVRRQTLVLLHGCPTTHAALVRFLRYLRVTARDAADVADARRLVDAGPVDGVLYDPEHDDTLGAWLREAHPSLPALQVEPRLEALRDPDGVELCARPVDLAHLDAALQRLLGGHA